MTRPARPADMSEGEWYGEAGTNDHLDEFREEEEEDHDDEQEIDQWAS